MPGQIFDSARERLATWRQAIVERTAQWRLAVRLVVAGGVALGVAKGLALPQGYWSVITAIIVIQSNVGGSLKAARDRLIATFLGAAAGLAAVSVMPRTGAGGVAAFLLALMPTALAAAASPTYRIAPITAAMMLLSVSTTLTPFELGIDRVIEIALGGAIGIAVSLVVLPARAHRDLREVLRRALTLMAGAFAPMLAGLEGTRDDPALRLQHRQIRAALAKADGIAEEARREQLARLTDERDPEALVVIVRRLHTNLLLLSRATMHPLPAPVRTILMPPLRGASAGLHNDLEAVGRALVDRAPPPDLAGVDGALLLVDQSLGKLRAEGLTRALAIEQIQSLYAVAFAFAQFRRDLIELHARVGEQAVHPH
jgi:uncharacterized membrane protein YccC